MGKSALGDGFGYKDRQAAVVFGGVSTKEEEETGCGLMKGEGEKQLLANANLILWSAQFSQYFNALMLFTPEAAPIIIKAG